jgi:hypothetical protein
MNGHEADMATALLRAAIINLNTYRALTGRPGFSDLATLDVMDEMVGDEAQETYALNTTPDFAMQTILMDESYADLDTGDVWERHYGEVVTLTERLGLLR